MSCKQSLVLLILLAMLAIPARAQLPSGVLEYGNENLLNTGSYPSDPKAGATLLGLAPNAATFAANSFGHGYPFSPSPGDFPGTDQIYVGSVQSAFHDGYSQYSGRLNGPQVITMNYGSLVPVNQSITTLTLGIASDDFQNAVFGQPFMASINGVVDTALTSTLNSLNETGPVEHFFSIGIDPSLLSSADILTLSINEGGDGGDGWAIDFLTIGVTTSAVPEPSSILLLGLATVAVSVAAVRARSRHSRTRRERTVE